MSAPLCALTEPAETDTAAVCDPKPVAIIKDPSLTHLSITDARLKATFETDVFLFDRTIFLYFQTTDDYIKKIPCQIDCIGQMDPTQHKHACED